MSLDEANFDFGIFKLDIKHKKTIPCHSTDIEWMQTGRFKKKTSEFAGVTLLEYERSAPTLANCEELYVWQSSSSSLTHDRKQSLFLS